MLNLYSYWRWYLMIINFQCILNDINIVMPRLMTKNILYISLLTIAVILLMLMYPNSCVVLRQIFYVWVEFWPLEPIIKLTMVSNWKLTFTLGVFLPYEPFSMKEWSTCSAELLNILKTLDSSASCREFIIEWVVEARVTLLVPVTLRRQQLRRCTERQCKTKPWGCWCAPRRPAHTLRPGWCGNHLHVPQPETRWRCIKQLFYLCTTANKLRLEFSRMPECTSFVFEVLLFIVT